MFTQIYNPVGHSLGLSTIFAVLPLLVIFVLLGVLKMRAQWAALIALIISMVVAVAVYSMPIGQTLSAAGEGAAFGIFPIMWIVVNAIWLYTMTVGTGHFDVLRRSFGTISEDQRVQAVIVAFCFGALLEALAGFGTPVAITSVMLIALGFSKLKAAAVALVANTAPVAFGALAVPITTLAKITGLPEHDLAATVGRQTPVLAVMVPLALVFMVDGRRGVKQTWLPALLCGVVFAVLQFLCSNYVSIPLTDIIAALGAALTIVILLRFWQPTDILRGTALSESEVQARIDAAKASAHEVELGAGRGGVNAEAVVAAGSLDATSARDNSPSVGGLTTARRLVHDHDVHASRHTVGPPEARAHPAATSAQQQKRDRPADVVRAYAPYLIIIAVFSLAQITAVKNALLTGSTSFAWPGLHVGLPNGKTPSAATFAFSFLDSGGTLLLIAGVMTMLALRVSPTQALRDYAHTLVQLKWAILTVAAVLALAYVMNLSGQTVTIGTWMAEAGGVFALLSPILGWLGVAVTGSDTSANALFGSLQVAAAHSANLPPVLLAAANSSGGVLGKMISPQNLAIAAASVGLAGEEGILFRKLLPWTFGFLGFMCILIYLQSTPVLSWMLA